MSREFKGSLEGWTMKHLAANYWRVESTMSRLDVLQEAQVKFLVLCQKYPDVEDRHFMALYKTAWQRHFIDLAKQNAEQREHTQPDYGFDGVGELDNAGYVRTLIRQAPREIKTVLSVLLNAPTELLELAADSWRAKGKQRAGGNKQVSQWLGLPEGSTPLDDVERYFRAD